MRVSTHLPFIALLMASVSTVSPVARASAANCNRKTTALTSSCSSLCFDGRPCIAYSGDANLTACTAGSAFSSCKRDTTSTCAYECFTNGPNDNAARGIVDFTTYTFLIPFGQSVSNWESNWSAAEKAAWEATEDHLADWTTSLPAKSNDVVQAIEPLSFLKATKRVTIAGGTSTDGQRGKVAKVSLATQLLSSQTQLEALTLANLQLDQYPQSTFPTQLRNFSFVNCVAKEYPADLPLMTALQVLDLSKNYFASFPVKFSVKTVTTLNLSTNSLISFDGDFPNVTTLDLSGNTLTAIPERVFAMSNLKTLYLGSNAFSSVVLTREQASFLSNLSLLSIDSFGAPATCTADADRVTLGNVPVCVTSKGSTSTTPTPGATTNNSSSNTGAIVGAVLGILALFAIIAGVVWYRRRRNRNSSYKLTNGNGGTSATRSGETGIVSLWSDQELLSLQVNIDDIEDVKKLGSGAYGVVYLAKYRTHRLVACKRLKKGEATWQNTQAFVAEIKLVAKLEHPRVVALVGVAWTIESDLQALFEFMDGGDLRAYLENAASPRHWSTEKLQIAIDVVEALVYVHSFTPPLVHRDLKSRNVLLSADLRAKLSDFGIARFRSYDNTMTTGVGTGRWLAPEVISGSNDYDQSCDIFAFGVVLSEIDTHALPYEDVVGPNGNRLADVAILQMVASGNLRPTFAPSCPLEVVNIATRCLALERANRPSAVEVAYALRTLLKSNDFYVV